MARKSAPEYPPLPYHGIRALTFLSASIVSGVLVYFCYQLKHDNFKIPWTFLIVLAASIPAIIALALTACVKSTLFALFINIPILLVWSLGFVLLAWNMYGALGHSCTKANWGSSDGIMICQTYKALFAFTVIGLLAAIAGIILDFRVRARQMSLGTYDRMQDGKSGGEEWDVRMDTFDATTQAPIQHGPRPTLNRSPYDSYDDSDSYNRHESFRDEGRPVYGGSGNVSISDFQHQVPYQHSTYDSRSYSDHPRSSFDPAPAHHGNFAYDHDGRY